MKFLDRASVGSVKETKEGYLVATARVARTGMQEYLASELEDVAINAGFKPNDVVRLYRHPDEVFHKDSLATITRLPVTINHPGVDVTSENWAALSVGEIGDAYTTEPEWVIVNPMIKDAKAVEAARTTHKEISMGYTAKIIKARDGIDADFEVSHIRYNHIALVKSARAGDKARIGDEWGAIPVNDFQPGNSPTPKGGRMPELKTVVLGDRAVQVADSDVLAIENFKTASAQLLADAKAETQKLADAKAEEIGALKVELKKAQDAAVIDVDALVEARTDLLNSVKAVDSAIEVKGKSDAELRKAAVVSKLGDAAVAGASDAEIKGMFTVIAKDAAKVQNPVHQAFKAGAVLSVGDASAMAAASLAKHDNDMNAWRNQ